MIRAHFSRRRLFALALVAAILTLSFAARAVRAGQNSQQGQQPQGQSDQSQGQSQSQSQGKQKKKGGFLSGVKSMTESSKEQTSATTSAGTKGVGNQGAKVGEVTPTPADQQAVAAMESYALPQGALPKFIEGGKLKPKQ